jgi:acetoin utilization deacetylase AcuC-like enzyme
MTLLVHDPVFLEHDTGTHPECAERLRVIAAEFEKRDLFRKCTPLKYKPIDEAAILRLHTANQLKIAKETAAQGGGRIEVDTLLSPRSYEVALRAAGACVAAVDAVMAGKGKTSFSIVRPPGHHATPDRSMGFCLFNNVALAADHARTKHGLTRILIVDWDVHHGNGTQDIFYTDSQVCFVSLHRYGAGFYPGTGSADETGTGDGLGYNVNIALQSNIARKMYVDQFRSVVEATADWFRPELILLSAGFDAHRLDPIGNLGLEAEDFATMTQIVLDVAKAHTAGRLVSCLEGGYHWQATAESAATHVETLLASSKSR